MSSRKYQMKNRDSKNVNKGKTFDNNNTVGKKKSSLYYHQTDFKLMILLCEEQISVKKILWVVLSGTHGR